MTTEAPVFLLAPPQRDEADYLTRLCLRSKQHWGYDEKFMATCRDELTITSADFDRSRLMTARINGKIAGVVQLTINRQEENGKLSKLFVHPDYLHQGIGSALYQWAVSSARHSVSAPFWWMLIPTRKHFISARGLSASGKRRRNPCPAGFSRCY